MSKALDYLLKTRPEAMESYFKFLKAAGKHLDPKTRAIISVITKVDKQTKAGFRQYLTRALREGVSADEILDALLVAFPTLGLTKIVWAVDQLLEMDIEDFHPEKLGGSQVWHDIADIKILEQDKVTCVSTAQRTFFVFTDGTNFQVFDNTCPHQSTSIPENAIKECAVTCPKHRWKFDLRTGDCIEYGDKPLTKMNYKIEDDRLLVCW